MGGEGVRNRGWTRGFPLSTSWRYPRVENSPCERQLRLDRLANRVWISWTVSMPHRYGARRSSSILHRSNAKLRYHCGERSSSSSPCTDLPKVLQILRCRSRVNTHGTSLHPVQRSRGFGTKLARQHTAAIRKLTLADARA